MKVKALIAVRSGSQRVKNKNTRPFGDTNLLELKIKQLKRIPNIDGIIVNSDDENMLEIARKLDVETIKRDDYYASNEVCMSDVYRNMAENIDTDIIVYANATNPIIKDETIELCINKFISKINEFDSLNTAHEVKEFMFKDNKPINYNLDNQPRSQDLPEIYALNFAISIISRENMIKYKNVVGKKPNIFPIDAYEAIDIDNEIDFEFAEYLYLKNKKNK